MTSENIPLRASASSRDPFFSTPSRIAAMRAAALRWCGTPFAPASAIHGPRGGVCCHRAVIAVIAEAGFPWTQDEVPDGTLNRATHHAGSEIADWLDAHPDRFARPYDRAASLASPDSCLLTPDSFLPGDILLIRHGIGAHHVAVMLDGNEIFQSLQKVGAHITAITPSDRRRLSRIYRPLQLPSLLTPDS